jgi:hypothetical protein
MRWTLGATGEEEEEEGSSKQNELSQVDVERDCARLA